MYGTYTGRLYVLLAPLIVPVGPNVMFPLATELLLNVAPLLVRLPVIDMYPRYSYH